MSQVNVIYHYEHGAWWADSPDIARWSAAAEDVVELVSLVAEGVSFALERDDVEITHLLAPDLMGFFSSATTGAVARLTIAEMARDVLPEPPGAGVREILQTACL